MTLKVKKSAKPKVDPTFNNYANIDKEFLEDEITYDNSSEMNISLPANLALLGTTGSGKSNFLISLICDMAVFNKIILYLANPNQPLYKQLVKRIRELETKTKTSILQVHDNIDNVVSPTDIDPSENTLIVFDDFQNEKVSKQKNIVDIFTRGRTRQITAVYIAQTYYKGIPSVIRSNLQYLCIFKVEQGNDLTRILSDKSLGIDKKTLVKLFTCIKSKGVRNFMMIDGKTNNPDMTFRFNYTGIPMAQINSLQ